MEKKRKKKKTLKRQEGRGETWDEQEGKNEAETKDWKEWGILYVAGKIPSCEQRGQIISQLWHPPLVPLLILFLLIHWLQRLGGRLAL